MLVQQNEWASVIVADLNLFAFTDRKMRSKGEGSIAVSFKMSCRFSRYF